MAQEFDTTAEDSEYYQRPAFSLATDAHTLLGTDPNPDSEKGFLESSIELVTKGTTATLLVAGNEIANIPATIGRMFGGDAGDYEIISNRQRIADFDDDLAKYYDAHQTGIDVAGFIVGSFVPGLGATKVLRVGQVVAREAIAAGNMGKMTANALGLVAPNQQKFLAQAIRQIGKTGNVFSMTEANTAKALLAGVHQNFLEGAIFTAAVNATMNQSPVMDQRDASDLTWDVLTGGLLDAVIGGGIAGIATRAAIKRGADVAENSLKGWTRLEEPITPASPSDRILFRLRQIDAIPEIDPTFEFAERAGREAQRTKTSLWTDIRKDAGELAGGDQQIADMLMHSIEKLDTNKNIANLLEAQSITRINTTSSIEKKYNAAYKKLRDNPLAATDEDKEEFLKYSVSFLDNRTGDVLSERPALQFLGDKLKPGESITLSKDGRSVQVGSYKKFSQENNPYRAFNIMGLTHEQIEARQVWSEMIPKFADDGSVMIHETDLPLLQKAQREGISQVKIIPESGVIADARTLSSVDEIAEFTKTKQAEIAERLLKAETIPQSVDDLVGKLKHYLGINFNTISDPASGYSGFFSRITGTVGDAGKIVKGDVIGLEKTRLLGRPLMDVIRTLKHEEGHAMFQSLLDARGVTKSNLGMAWPALADEIKEMSAKVRPALWKSTDPKMVAYRENWHELFADAFSYLSRNPKLMDKYAEFDKFAGHLVRPIPQEVLDAVSKRATKPSKAEIAKIVNAHEDVLFGGVEDASKWDLRNATREMVKQGGRDIDPFAAPTYSKVIVRSDRMRGVDGNLLEGMAVIDQKAKLHQEATDRVVADSLSGIADITDANLPSSAGMKGKIIGQTAGPGAVAAESGAYGSWSSFFSYVGQRAHNMITAAKQQTAEIFNPTLLQLASKTEDAIEWSVLNEKLRSLPNRYFLNAAGDRLVYGKEILEADFMDAAGYSKALAARASEIEELAKRGIPTEVPLNSPLVRKLAADHISRNNTRKMSLQKIHANNGYQDRFDEGVFYPIPRNLRDTPHFAFVVDEHATATGHSQMIYAKDAATLEQMRNQIMSDPKLREMGLTVLSKGESEEYYKSVGKFEFERTLSENYINTALARSGKSASFLPVTDPNKIVTDFLEWHQARDAAHIRTVIEHKYARDFDYFKTTAQPAIEASKSRFGYISPLSYAENTVKNPATNLIKMALDVSNADEYPLWTPLNKFLDAGFSAVVDKVGKLFSSATSVEHLDEVNAALTKAGYKGALVDAPLYEAMNGTVPRGKLSTIVNRANSIIATLSLRADPLNALNNAVGSAVLLGPETKALMKTIRDLSPDGVAEFNALAKIKVPGSGGDLTMAPGKMIAKRIADFHNDKAGREWFKRNGFISTIADQYDSVLDNIALAVAKGEETYLSKAMLGAKKLGDQAEKFSANKLAEEFNRYVAAGVAKDITDIAVKRGLMTEDVQLSYVNTFVNRTQGNYLASQRPAIFQGPIGQSIGLFQTYQFNLLQQVFRHIGEGQYKNVALMAGLQGGIYGLNGLPAFNAINTHIIGSAGGNIEHKNLYDAIFSGAGKEAGEWLLYGGLSNGLGLFHPDLKTNIYSRGDINPRHITLIPTDPSKTPIYQATERLLSNLKEGYTKVSMGGDIWTTFLKGVEQNGISRPLAGMAQILEAVGRDDKKVISTNQQGNMLMAHDLYSLSSLMRIAGAKPLDEAIVNDTMFRVNSYRTADAARRKVLGETIKNTILAGGNIDQEQVANFADAYARTGGSQAKFGAFYANQYKNANVSQAEQLRTSASGGKPIAMQVIMNGGISNEEY